MAALTDTPWRDPRQTRAEVASATVGWGGQGPSEGLEETSPELEARRWRGAAGLARERRHLSGMLG